MEIMLQSNHIALDFLTNELETALFRVRANQRQESTETPELLVAAVSFPLPVPDSMENSSSVSENICMPSPANISTYPEEVKEVHMLSVGNPLGNDLEERLVCMTPDQK